MSGKINSEKVDILLAGDYNINLLNYDTHSKTEEFVNQIYAHLCFPLITRPTPFSQTSSTLIDNIISSIFDDHCTAGV